MYMYLLFIVNVHVRTLSHVSSKELIFKSKQKKMVKFSFVAEKREINRIGAVVFID